MKKTYIKPLLAVEHYELTQTVASCTGMKIGFSSSECVLKDPDSTNQMKDFAKIGFFLGGSCTIFANGMSEKDGICYHTNTNAAFNS